MDIQEQLHNHQLELEKLKLKLDHHTKILDSPESQGSTIEIQIAVLETKVQFLIKLSWFLSTLVAGSLIPWLLKL